MSEFSCPWLQKLSCVGASSPAGCSKEPCHKMTPTTIVRRRRSSVPGGAANGTLSAVSLNCVHNWWRVMMDGRGLREHEICQLSLSVNLWGGWGGREYNTTSAIRQLMSSVRPLAR